MPNFAGLTDAGFPPLAVIDVDAARSLVVGPWSVQTLSRINGVSDLVLGVLMGENRWHKHDASDELFYVVEAFFTWKSKVTRP